MENNLCSQRLAIIEDDEDINELISAFFRQKNYKIASFSDPRELLKELEKNTLPFDAIITDLMLPNFSGIELTKKLRSMGNETPIILVTSLRSSERAIEAIEAGAYDFVLKPIQFPQLQVSVERALHFNRIKKENAALKSVVSQAESVGKSGIIGRSPGLLKAVDLAKRVSNSSANVFISGETGTGKEVIAKAIHFFGSRAKEPFVAINCSAIPENLLESELFGHAKGAFTGAADKKLGLFEEAGEGTLFLDEIGDLSLPLQSKLLRTLQERRIKRIGENQYRPVHARIISATHKDLRRELKEKLFREDLFFRLNVIPIHLPPLRERREDIIPLAEHFLKKYSSLNGRSVQGFTKGALEYLLKNSWSGNVRELENAIERAVVLCSEQWIDAKDLLLEDMQPQSIESWQGMPQNNDSSTHKSARSENDFFGLTEADQGALVPLDDLINRYLVYALNKNHGAKDKTARDLGIDRKTLYRRLQEMNRGSSPIDRSHSANFNQEITH